MEAVARYVLSPARTGGIVYGKEQETKSHCKEELQRYSFPNVIFGQDEFARSLKNMHSTLQKSETITRICL